MRQQRVLLVEDHVAFNSQLREAFGQAEISHVRSVRELYALEVRDWDYAFIDFHLGDDDLTGLSAYMYLQKESPQTKCITLSALGDGGRTLFAVAASHWFGAWATVDKRILDQVVTGIPRGTNPTPDRWREALHHHAHLIDGFFQQPSWVQFWRRWLEAGGTHRGMAMLIPGSLQACLNFAGDNVVNVDSFSRAFPGAGPVRPGKPQVVVSTFVDRHHLFFQAPDLVAAVDAAAPWDRRHTHL